MSTAKRKRNDVEVGLEALPIQDDAFLRELNSKLSASLEAYRTRVDALTTENDRLLGLVKEYNFLVSSVAHVWDMLNGDLALKVAEKPSTAPCTFWNELTAIKFPFTVTNLTPEVSKISLTHKSLSIEDSVATLQKRCNDFIKLASHLNFPANKDQELVSKLLYCCLSLNEELQLTRSFLHSKTRLELQLDQYKKQLVAYKLILAKDNPEALAKLEADSKEHDAETRKITGRRTADDDGGGGGGGGRLKQAKSRSEATYKSGRFNDNYERYNDSRQASDSTKSSSGANSIQDTQVLVIENEEAIVSSILYNRLFKQAQRLDDALQASLQEVALLRAQLSQENRHENVQAESVYKEQQQLMSTLSETNRMLLVRLDKLKLEHQELQQKHEQLLESHKADVEMLQAVKGQLTETQEHLKAFTKSMANNTTSGGGHKDPELQILSLELEEITRAYESKAQSCNSLLKQMQDMQTGQKQKMAEIAKSWRDKSAKVAQLCEAKVAAAKSQMDALQRSKQLYRQGWLLSFKKCMHLEQQRDVATAALAQTQGQTKTLTRQLSQALHVIGNLKREANAAATTAATTTAGSHVGIEGFDEDLETPNNALALRRKLLCSLCMENFRDQCLVKCGHVFCIECLETNLKHRNRKCPHCKVAFDRTDIQKIYLD